MADEKKNIVKVEEKTTVYATDKSKFYTEGEAIKVHPLLAKKLIKSGKVTDKAPKK